eukprot:TRINITY_DN470_c0_g1_i5.p1 TRINITY_DN470_c0_g1~~TRINITY_DN470_c0_g1_i5.p1  ORF type:complete len:632 (+),score=195.18 TRINITY_DN470_c0_g1_i5:320-2215(+)
MTTPFNSASLYVGDLPTDVTESSLFETFSQVGQVASIRVCRDAVTRRSLGYAYVNYHNAADAERALDTLNNTLVKGKPCRVMWSQRDPALRKSGVGNVFIKNLDKGIDHKALYDTFSAFGNILSCKVVTDTENSSKGYGFVHFETAESAEKAIQKVNGMSLNGQKVFVGHFLARKERVPSDSEQKFTNVYIKNLDSSVTEDEIRALVSDKGTISNLAIMKDEKGVSKGFGFINFEKPEDAKAAVEVLNNKEIKGKAIYAGRAQKKSERESELRHKYEQQRAERANKYQGVNLYVKNLEDNVDDEKLRAEFAAYGTITSSKVMSDEKAASKGFGFVCFSSPEEATRAVTEMNGKMMGTKPLYVALAQRKDIRKAQLEAQHSIRLKAGLPPGPMGRMPPGGPMGPGMGYPNAPMFYPQPGPGMPPGGQMMYPPGQMMPRQRMYPNPQGGFQGMGGGMPPHYVVPGGPGGMQRGGHNPRGPRGGAGMQQMGGPGMNKNVGPGQRRPGPGAVGGRGRAPEDQAGQVPRPAPQAAPEAPAAVPAPAASQGESVMPPLSVKLLQGYPAEQQRMILGERLYPQVASQQPELAGKITGMLLDSFNVSETIHLIENGEALQAKIVEAVDVLKQHQATGAQ